MKHPIESSSFHGTFGAWFLNSVSNPMYILELIDGCIVPQSYRKRKQ